MKSFVILASNDKIKWQILAIHEGTSEQESLERTHAPLAAYRYHNVIALQTWLEYEAETRPPQLPLERFSLYDHI